MPENQKNEINLFVLNDLEGGVVYVEFSDDELAAYPRLLTDGAYRQSYLDDLKQRSPLTWPC